MSNTQLPELFVPTDQATTGPCSACKGSFLIATGTPSERIPCDCICGSTYLDRYNCKLLPDHLGTHKDGNVHWDRSPND